MNVNNIADVADDIHLTLTRDLTANLAEQLLHHLRVELPHMRVPVLLVQLRMHTLTLSGMECLIPREHKASASFAHEEAKTLEPSHFVFVQALKDFFFFVFCCVVFF